MGWNHSTFWTDEEKDILRSVYSGAEVGGRHDLAVPLLRGRVNHGEKAIKAMARHLGLAANEKAMQEPPKPLPAGSPPPVCARCNCVMFHNLDQDYYCISCGRVQLVERRPNWQRKRRTAGCR